MNPTEGDIVDAALGRKYVARVVIIKVREDLTMIAQRVNRESRPIGGLLVVMPSEVRTIVHKKGVPA